MADDDKQGAALGEYAVRQLKLKRLAVVDDRTAYGQGLADAFAAAVKGAGGEVVKREYVSDKDFDFPRGADAAESARSRRRSSSPATTPRPARSRAR